MIKDMAGMAAAGVLGVVILALVAASMLKNPKETCQGKNS
jgi:hypothetical protein|tara:strand:- start:462 stop:581 length:120 start_codon:yes stop_codon:yes gene_type:complete